MNTQSVETKVEKVEINLDELFEGAASASSVTIPSDDKKKVEPKTVNIFSKEKPVDFSFTEPSSDDNSEEDDDSKDDAGKPAAKPSTQETSDLLDSFGEEDEDEQKVETRGRKKIDGIADVFQKLIKEDKIVPFEDE